MEKYIETIEHPCRLGETVYEVKRMVYGECKRAGIKTKIGRGYFVWERPFIVREKQYVKTMRLKFGKTVFLTREEAETAMAKFQDIEATTGRFIRVW